MPRVGLEQPEVFDPIDAFAQSIRATQRDLLGQLLRKFGLGLDRDNNIVATDSTPGVDNVQSRT